MDAVRRLKEKFLGAGGTQSDFEALGRGHLELGDTERQDGSTRPEEARALAHKCMRHGSLVEMHCYDGRGRGQGEAVIVFQHWLDKESLVFRGEHLVASDEYYEWWSTHEADFNRIAFHICEKARHRCKVEGGPREEVIHLTKWRMASPQTLIGSGFASTKAIGYFAGLLDHHLATAGPLPPAAPAAVAGAPPGEVEPLGGRPLAHTSGLDMAAMAGGRHHERGDDEAVDELLALAKRCQTRAGGTKKGAKKRERPRKGP